LIRLREAFVSEVRNQKIASSAMPDDKCIVDEYGFAYKKAEEVRGANEKFWIKNYKDYEGIYGSYLFKSSNRRNSIDKQSARSFGEIMAQNIARDLNLDYVVYMYSCIEKQDGETLFGTICPSYKKTKDDVEITGLDITKRYMAKNGISTFDDKSMELNTVYGYVKQLSNLYGEEIESERLDELKLGLLKCALFDYCTCQTDRHWCNLGFLGSNKDGVKNLELIPLYDNEKCFLSNKPLGWMEVFSNQLLRSKQNKSNDAIAPLLSAFDRVPRLGIKTSTVVLSNDINNALLPRRPSEDEENPFDVFSKELAGEINENAQLRDFYFQIKSLDIKKTLQDEDIPESVRIVACNAWNGRIDTLDKVYEQNFGKLVADESYAEEAHDEQ